MREWQHIFEIATAITLPWMIKKLFTKRSAQYVTACAAVLYFIYFLYEFGVSKAIWQRILIYHTVAVYHKSFGG